MNLIDRFTRAHYDSMEDFSRNLSIRVPEDFNFAYDVCDEYARLTPEKRALLWVNDDGEEKSFTFAQMRDESNRMANMLRAKGIGKGDAVMVLLMQRYEYWPIAMALHKLGAILIPATHMLTAKDILYRCQAADIKMVICVEEAPLLDGVDAAMAKAPTLRHRLVISDAPRPGWESLHALTAPCSADFPRPQGKDATSAHDPMLIYFTSGTTGMPKMVLQDFSYPLAHIVTAAFWQNVQDGGLHLTVADTGWAKASWGKIYGQWIAGSAIFVYDYERFHADRMCEVITRYQVTTFCAPATVYRFLIKENLSAYDFSHMKYACVAGEPLNPEVQSQWVQQTGLPLMEAYGQSESTPIAGTFIWMKPKPGSMGKINPCYRVALLNDDGEPAGYGEEGEVCIYTAEGKPTGLFNGYYRAPELTESVWHDGYYHTGDVAWQDEDGYLWFVGRADDVIKSSGYRIGPFEVESVIMEHPAVLECAVTGTPDPVRGQAVKATIVLARGYEPSDALVKEIQTYVKKATAPYKYPRVVVFVDELPKTPSGKIRRKEIVRMDMEAYRAAQQH